AGTSWCWGRNRYSQLANGSVYARSQPQKVIASASTGPITSVAAGDSHACGIATIGASMWCWGLSLQGQLGDGGSSTRPRGTAIWPNGVTMKSIGTDAVARLVVAGDISCDERRIISNGIGAAGSQCGDAATASLTTSLNPDGVVVLGDIQYEAASISEIQTYFDTTWGPLKNRMYPIRGNHEYITAGAAGYIEYFGAMSPSYWVSNAGGWRIIAVDSWCQGQIYAGCSATSVQTTWLTSELARARAEGKCAAVLMHHPYVSSGRFATPSVESLWKASVLGGADLVMTGHDHHYERFAPLDEDGFLAETGTPGTPLIISGLGGAPSYPLRAPEEGSQFMTNANHGVLSLTLTPTNYSWAFISASDNATIDSGTASCAP
ncbi:MAG: Alkaline phosphatase precursor, partial [Actinomycetota bacterium]